MRTTTTRRTAVAALATLALVASACGSDEAAEVVEDTAEVVEEAADDAVEDTAEVVEEAADAVESDGPIKIGIVAPSASNDLAFTQSIIDSVSRVGEGRDIEVSVTDGMGAPADGAAAIRGYAEDGVDLVIAHGSQYGGGLEEIAPDFPEISFAWGTAADTFGLDNVYAYSVAADQGGYVNGIIAAQLTESNVLGVIGPIEVGDAALYVNGFVAGVAAQNADATVNVNYIESFSDVALASEAANAHVSNGADVLTGTAQMVVGATGVATENDIPWFGTQSDQTDLAPGQTVVSQVYHWEVVLNEVLDNVAAGTLGGESFTLTFENGGLEMAFNSGFALDADVQASADAAIAGLTDGSLTTGV